MDGAHAQGRIEDSEVGTCGMHDSDEENTMTERTVGGKFNRRKERRG